MDFEKILDYLKSDSMDSLDLQQIENYIDAVCSIEFVAKWEQEDFITSFEKVIAKKIGLYSACDYNVYHVGYIVALEQLAKRKHELREVLQAVDTRELYLLPKEVEGKEMKLKKLDIVEDITLLLQDFTDIMQLERISHQMDRLNYSRYHGNISSEEFIYQQEKIQSMKLWYDYNRESNFICRTGVSLDNERWEVIRLKNKGEILAYQYSLYHSYFQEAERFIELEKEGVEERFLSQRLCFPISETEIATVSGVYENEDSAYLAGCLMWFDYQNQLHNVQNRKLVQESTQGDSVDYSLTTAYQELVQLLPKLQIADTSSQKLYVK